VGLLNRAARPRFPKEKPSKYGTADPDRRGREPKISWATHTALLQMTTPSSEAQSSSEYRLRSLQYTITSQYPTAKAVKDGQPSAGRPRAFARHTCRCRRRAAPRRRGRHTHPLRQRGPYRTRSRSPHTPLLAARGASVSRSVPSLRGPTQRTAPHESLPTALARAVGVKRADGQARSVDERRGADGSEGQPAAGATV
jgi:hypothetical protein